MDIAPSTNGHPLVSRHSGQSVSRGRDAQSQDSPTSSEASGEHPQNSRQAPTQTELREIQKLAKRDREVRAHEQAHASVGGAFAGSPSYQFQSGPNGVSYAVGGHVSIDVSAVSGDPSATLAKMITVQRAALAPQSPSPQDRTVAARASQKAAQARVELAEVRLEEGYGQSPGEVEPGKIVDVTA